MTVNYDTDSAITRLNMLKSVVYTKDSFVKNTNF